MANTKKSKAQAKHVKAASKPVKKSVKAVKEATAKRNFLLLDKKMNKLGKYTGNSPRQAALKIANAGVTDIMIREAGKRRSRTTRADGKITEILIHSYKGSRKQRPKTASDPAWLPDMVNIPHVKKLGTEWVVKDA